MPEAPEVEAVARSLRPVIRGQRILDCRVLHRIAVPAEQVNSMPAMVRGQKILAVQRLGKYLLLQLDRGAVVLHFRFDGQLLWFDSGAKTPPNNIHLDVLFRLNRGLLGFVDPRHLGRVAWYRSIGEVRGLSSLGVDASSPKFTPLALAGILQDSPRALKIVLLDQTRIAGIGNIYSSEILWSARLDPRQPADALKESEIRRLHKGVVSVLRRALECCLDPPPNFRDPEWWFADLDRILAVYGREGAPCRRCRTKIRRIEQGGRSTYFCPRCQT